jgi:hypothetical protein
MSPQLFKLLAHQPQLIVLVVPITQPATQSMSKPSEVNTDNQGHNPHGNANSSPPSKNLCLWLGSYILIAWFTLSISCARSNPCCVDVSFDHETHADSTPGCVVQIMVQDSASVQECSGQHNVS